MSTQLPPNRDNFSGYPADGMRDGLTALAAIADFDARMDALGYYMAGPWEGPLRRLAHRLVDEYRLDRNSEYDDVTQVIGTALIVFVEEIHADPKLLDEFDRPQHIFGSRAKQAVLRWTDSTEGRNMMGGQVNWRRKRRAIERSRGTLRIELDREPNDDEVIAHVNAGFDATRSDAKRQGYVTKQDLIQSSVYEDVDDYANASATSVQSEADNPVAVNADEAYRLALWTISEAQHIDPVLGLVAQMYFRMSEHSYIDESLTGAKVGAAIGACDRTGRDKLDQVRKLAREIAEKHMGVNGTYSVADDIDFRPPPPMPGKINDAI